jgi:hypothetical protein
MDVEAFLQRWVGQEGGAERANYQIFLSELCDVLGVARPDPAQASAELNNYVFERGVSRRESEGLKSTLRIDLYKRGCFILEAKQSRLPGGAKAIPQQAGLPGFDLFPEPRSKTRKWDAMMDNARRQAEGYVFRLDKGHAAPPFIIVCDVGHCLELYADFSGTGRGYSSFPDRQSYRINLEDLREAKIRERLVAVWTDPDSLNPARETARVTRQIADRLAAISKTLEKRHDPQSVAHFLMRCIFTMFAEDVDLLPRGKFTEMIEECLTSPDSFAPMLQDLWAKMDEPDHEKRFYSGFKQHLLHFNGNLFKNAKAYPLQAEEIGELLAAARADWTQVDPAIFGSLLEHALDEKERSSLGAHYTPRAYVERLVQATVMLPLREDWQTTEIMIQEAMLEGKRQDAIDLARDFHQQLCAVRVLDPACGTGNFLYVALELIKVLEGEVLETLARLGASEGLDLTGVDPHQFLGLELNPRAAAIAELVVWIGFLQQHYRTRSTHPKEPILRAFENINGGRGRAFDAVLTWDNFPNLAVDSRAGEKQVSRPNPRRPQWPEAEFIVGNPPFIGGKDLRAELGGDYAEALWAAHPQMNDSADLVMYWWDRAAEILTAKGTVLRRFGLITTNSISQVFQRKVTERHLSAKAPISLTLAIADHPWTKVTADSAAVRIAMTVARAGKHEGALLTLTHETGLDTDTPDLKFDPQIGKINADLTVGVDVTKAGALLANEGISSPGVKLHGSGFIVTPAQAEFLGLGKRPGLERHIRPYRNGKDVTGRSRNVMAIDLFGLSAERVRHDFPEVYSHVLEQVKPERDAGGKVVSYAEKWWEFGVPRQGLRAALEGLPRYIVTVETAKHRLFQFLDAEILPDNRLVCVALSDAFCLGILSSRPHLCWTSRMGGLLEDRPIYTKTGCFDPFPFPDASAAQKQGLRALGEELDATRKQVLADNPDLTLTGLYNVLEAIKAGAALSPEHEDVKHRGRILILKDLHDQIDAAALAAYGWPQGLSDQDLLARLVALNAERSAQEAAGHVLWLRPDYQAPRYAKTPQVTGELDLGTPVVAFDSGLPIFPKSGYESPAVLSVLMAAGRAMSAEDVSRAFQKHDRRRVQRIAKALHGLALFGHILPTEDGRYLARMAA